MVVPPSALLNHDLTVSNHIFLKAQFSFISLTLAWLQNTHFGVNIKAKSNKNAPYGKLILRSLAKVTNSTL